MVPLCDLLWYPQGHGVKVTGNNRDVVERSQVIWVAVKPHAISRVLSEVAPAIRTDHHLVISTAAGIPIKTLEKVSTANGRILLWNLRIKNIFGTSSFLKRLSS